MYGLIRRVYSYVRRTLRKRIELYNVDLFVGEARMELLRNLKYYGVSDRSILELRVRDN